MKDQLKLLKTGEGAADLLVRLGGGRDPGSNADEPLISRPHVAVLGKVPMVVEGGFEGVESLRLLQALEGRMRGRHGTTEGEDLRRQAPYIRWRGVHQTGATLKSARLEEWGDGDHPSLG